ncbi:MAG: hypothetical protein EPN86_01310 [Nanoarchaeota archaeon]|nr:MAG: hypothetical protein EPN86_01310 [Nanoarchaeota archaeon]
MIDLVFPNNNEERLLETAKKLGWKDVCFAYEFTNLKETVAKLKSQKTSAVIVTQSNFMQAKFAKIILQRAGEDPTQALKSGKVHGLLGIEKCRITQVHCKMARDNNIAFCFGLTTLLNPKNVSWLHRHAKLINKYKVPLILGSLAKSPHEMRGYHDLFGLFTTIGIEKGLVKKGFEFLEEIE